MRTRNFILIIASFLCMFVQNMMAQVYPFTTKILSNGWTQCEMDSLILVSKEEFGGITEVKILSQSAYGYDCVAFIGLSCFQNDDIVELCNKTKTLSDNDNIKLLESCIFDIYLDNGEILSSTETTLYDVRSKVLRQNELYGVCRIGFGFHEMSSSRHSFSNDDVFKKIQYVAHLLRTYSITKIVINGVTVELGDFKTKDTFDSMFNVLGEKIGEPEKFRYTSSSSSSSSSTTSSSSSSTTSSKTVTTSKPTATGNMGYLNVTPSGDIVCRIDDLNIVGGKGKNVQVMLVFDYEDKEENVSVFKENTTPSYDDSVYESFRIIGSVDEIKTLRNRNSARYGVYLWVWLDNGDGSFMTLAENKYGIVTIYKDGSGWALK